MGGDSDEACFRFNFDPVADRQPDTACAAQEAAVRAARQDGYPPPGTEVFPQSPAEQTPEQLDAVELVAGVTLYKGRVTSEAASALLGNGQLADSDLIPGTYEGGFKLWEGAADLAKFLCTEWGLTESLFTSPTDPCKALAGKKILELGCGQGLPGILAYLAGADVHFQDYNEEVLEVLTGPNLAHNRRMLPPGRRKGDVRYFASDWCCMGDLMGKNLLGGNYDIILSAETIYSLDSQHSLYECMKQFLRPPHGIAYVAAKTYYFGVGGGTTAFKKLLAQEGVLEAETVATIDDGASNKREILKLKFPDHIHPYFL
ncbi:hypothetical protein WJX72_004662 [[Myrmecia] bisecta]|uniref:protein-histidine N-methyltransferase n=1 Tax=[Myrmecia] bisecta TaxID=41462 RepID=A0AAW1R602_9CHLO